MENLIIAEDQLRCTLIKQYFAFTFKFKMILSKQVLFIGMIREIPVRHQNKLYIFMCIAEFPTIRLTIGLHRSGNNYSFETERKLCVDNVEDNY